MKFRKTFGRPFQFIKKYIFTFLILISVFVLLLFFSNLIPSVHFKKNISLTLSALEKEGIYPSFGLPFRKVVLDNYTDALMLNTAYSQTNITSVFLNPRGLKTIDETNQIANLRAVYQENQTDHTNYERYWHGYLIFLRPLLVFFPLSIIRVILLFISYFLAFYLFRLLVKKINFISGLSFLFGLLAVDFFFVFKSLQFSSVFIIGLVTSIYLIKYSNKDNYKNLSLLQFFVSGGLTSFFDLLTSPLVSLSLLLFCQELLAPASPLKLCFFWVLGYLSIWLSKWLIVNLFFSTDALTTALNQIINRTVTKPDQNFNYFQAIKLNLFQLIGYDKTNKFIILFAGIIMLLILIKYFKIPKNIKALLTWIFMSIIPYLWYLVAANHSYLHCWYTYRDQLLTVLSFSVIYFKFLNFASLKNDLIAISTALKKSFKRIFLP